MAFLVSFLVVFNILAWVVFLRNFKKLFTTEDVIEKAKSEINRIVIDLNANAERNISIIDDKINRLRALIAEAEKKIKLLDDINTKTAALNDFRVKMEKSARKNILPEKNYLKTAELPNPENAENLHDGVQSTLFDEVSSLNEQVRIQNNNSAAAYSRETIASPEVSVLGASLKVRSKSDLKDSIISLFDAGFSVEEIAAKLNCSTTEVSFALSLENRI
ncbi:MAG: hypothetical protein ACFNKL_02945 [Treponema sp.]